MAPTKHRPQNTASMGTGWSITGSILIAFGVICLIYAITALKMFFDLQNNMENANENGEGLEALGAVFGAIFAFSSIGIESLAIAIGIGIVGIVLLIVGISFFSIGFSKYYRRA